MQESRNVNSDKKIKYFNTAIENMIQTYTIYIIINTYISFNKLITINIGRDYLVV